MWPRQPRFDSWCGHFSCIKERAICFFHRGIHDTPSHECPCGRNLHLHPCFGGRAHHCHRCTVVLLSGRQLSGTVPWDRCLLLSGYIGSCVQGTRCAPSPLKVCGSAWHRSANRRRVCAASSPASATDPLPGHLNCWLSNPKTMPL